MTEAIQQLILLNTCQVLRNESNINEKEKLSCFAVVHIKAVERIEEQKRWTYGRFQKVFRHREVLDTHPIPPKYLFQQQGAVSKDEEYSRKPVERR